MVCIDFFIVVITPITMIYDWNDIWQIWCNENLIWLSWEREDPNNFPLEIISVNPPTGEVECYQALSHLDKLIS